MLEGAVQGKRGREGSIHSPQTGHTLTNPSCCFTGDHKSEGRAPREP